MVASMVEIYGISWLIMVNLWLFMYFLGVLPSGKHHHSYGKSPFVIGKSTISMGHWAIFSSYVHLPESTSFLGPLMTTTVTLFFHV